MGRRVLEPIEPWGEESLRLEPREKRTLLLLESRPPIQATHTHATHMHVRVELGAVMGQGICLESDADMSLRNDVSLKKMTCL